MNKMLVVATVSLASLLVVGCDMVVNEVGNSNSDTASNAKATTDTEVVSTSTTESNDSTVKKVAQYEMYDSNSHADYIGKKPHVLYFSADWCATCQTLKKKVQADLANFPEETEILQVNYDTATQLKKEYGVTAQTTFVVLDKDGKVVEKLVVPTVDKLKDAVIKSL